MLKDIFYHYNESILKILGFTLLIVLPLQVFYYGWIYYFSQIDLNNIENVLALYIYVLMFISTQRPFKKLYEKVKAHEEYTIINMLKDFVSSFGFVFVGAFVIFLFSYLGIVFFIIPGLIILTFAFFLPYYQDTNLTIKGSVKKAAAFYRNNLLSIYGDILLWTSVNVLIWALFIKGVAEFDINLMTYTVLRILINLFLFPLIYFYLSEKYDVMDSGDLHGN